MRRGITLLELLVAVIISGIVAAIVFAMFRGEASNYSKTKSNIKVQSDAREAVRIIEEELGNAGFRTDAEVATGVLTTTDCNTGYTNLNGFATRSSIKPLSDGIEYILYSPYPDGDIDCADDLVRIRYTWNGTDSILYRQWVQGAASDITTAPLVPFLEHVGNFQVTYGVLRDDAYLVTSAQSGTGTLEVSGLTQARADNGTSWTWTLTGWTTTTGSAWLNLGTGTTLDSFSTYRISFKANANDAAFDATKGIDFTTLKAGFFTSTGAATASVFTFKPGTSSASPRTIQYDLNPSWTGISDAVYFGVTGKLLAGAPSGSTAQVQLSDIKIQRVNRGRISTWAEPSSSTQDWSKIGAVRVNLTVRAKNNSVVTHERTILLPNNDPRI